MFLLFAIRLSPEEARDVLAFSGSGEWRMAICGWQLLGLLTADS